MQNKYKVNYRKDIKKVKFKKFISSIFIFIMIIVLSVFAIYCIYARLKKNNDNNVVIDSDANTSIENDADKNINNSITMEDDSNSGENISGEKNNEPDEDEKNGEDEKSSEDEKNIEDEKNSENIKEYVYGEKVPENEAVSDDYFDDAVFIGNSQIEGIAIYSSMKNATILAGKGIMVDTIFSKEAIKTENGSRITIMDSLAKEQFKKVYIMLGANELGWVFDYLFIEQYGKVIDKIKELQPNAKIYVNAIMPVSKEKSDKDKIYNNNNIDNYNNLILNMTKEKEVYFIDSKEALADEDGCLPADAGTDGVHFNGIYYEQWFNYLKTHTVN